MNVGQQVPNFKGVTSVGEIDLHHYIDGCWCVIVTHPNMFDAIHTTEVGHLSKMQKEFEARNCKLIGVTVGCLEDLEDWLQDVNLLQSCEVNYPIIADDDAEISRLLGTIANDAGPVASRFKLPISTTLIIDIDKNIQVQQIYPSTTGRNFYETLRALDSMQLTLFHQVATPANWKHGEECIVLPSMNSEEARECFPEGFTELKPYHRMVEQPGAQKEEF
eukprot:g716.t1